MGNDAGADVGNDANDAANDAPNVDDPRDAKTVSARSGPPRVAASSAPLAAPAAPGPRYRLGAEIARGGMGRVVEAVDTVLGRVVALKEVLTTDREALRRFARETRITARLEHPSIVPVHDAGTRPDGSPYYVMRKVSGRPLEHLVAEAETLNQRLAILPHVVAAAQAIAHAHERGIVHRDIKPSNILVGGPGETVVIDWGLAKVLDDPDDHDDPVDPDAAPVDPGGSLQTQVGLVFGTPGFMSPEQLSGAPVDERGDVYALGATLYYTLARCTPHADASGTAMMGAALAGPAAPIQQLVPGVPPELSTIVDKALAYAHADRYPDAGALAEDLQRFLTGQLVASHHYSPRARLKRFVRKHRVAVAIASVAILALVVGGVIAFTRVITERDRADGALADALAQSGRADRALADALEQNDRLMIFQAEALLPTNPTAALALVKPLAATKWREVRAIAMAARARGTAWGYPASTDTHTIALDAAGTHCLAIGRDHVIRIHDLVAHTSRVIATIGNVQWGTFADHDTRVVVWSADQIVAIELATGAQRVIAGEVRGEHVAIADHTAWWVDGAGRVNELDLRAVTPPRVIDVPDPGIRMIEGSPDQRWIAMGSDQHVWLVDRRATSAPRVVLDGSSSQVTWAPNGKRFTVVVDGRGVWMEIDPVPRVVQRVEDIVHMMAVRDDVAYAASYGRIVRLTPAGVTVMFKRDDFHVTNLRVARDDTLVAHTTSGEVLVLADRTFQIVHAPVGTLRALASSASSGFIVASTPGLLLAWDLDQLLPSRVPVPPHSLSFAVVGPHQLLVQYPGRPAAWVDLITRDVVAIEDGSEILRVQAPPEGDMVLLLDANQHGRLYRRATPGAVVLEGELAVAVFTEGGHVIAADGGALYQHTLATATRELLLDRKTVPITTLTTSGLRVAGRFDDGMLWRHDLTTGHDDLLPRRPVEGAQWIELDAAGAVYFAEGDRLMRWAPDQTVVELAKLPHAITDMTTVENGDLFIVTDDGAGFVLEVASGQLASRLPSGTRLRNVMVSRGLVIALESSGTIVAIDAATSIRWPLARAASSFAALGVTAGGQHAIAVTGEVMLEWRLVVPKTRDETLAWIETLTNARAPTGPAVLTWE